MPPCRLVNSERERAHTLTVPAVVLKAAKLEREANGIVLEAFVAPLEVKSSENANEEENWKDYRNNQ